MKELDFGEVINGKTMKRFRAKQRDANKRGIDFSISPKEFAKINRVTRCAYTGLPFQGSGWFAKSCDRIDHTKGYVPGNVIMVLQGVNCLKGRMEEKTSDPDEILNLLYGKYPKDGVLIGSVKDHAKLVSLIKGHLLTKEQVKSLICVLNSLVVRRK